MDLDLARIPSETASPSSATPSTSVTPSTSSQTTTVETSNLCIIQKSQVNCFSSGSSKNQTNIHLPGIAINGMHVMLELGLSCHQESLNFFLRVCTKRHTRDLAAIKNGLSTNFLRSSPMSTSTSLSDCFESIVPESDIQIDHDPLPSTPAPSSYTLSPIFPLHDVNEPDLHKEIKVDETYDPNFIQISTISSDFPLHDFKDPDSNKEIKDDQAYYYLPQGICLGFSSLG
ncbi:hypothetical protein ZWY2020_059543 [Hordeum vulgare]|nr:hypothetical protein ZWY2020_059543 [Hordeum vulgare]